MRTACATYAFGGEAARVLHPLGCQLVNLPWSGMRLSATAARRRSASLTRIRDSRGSALALTVCVGPQRSGTRILVIRFAWGGGLRGISSRRPRAQSELGSSEGECRGQGSVGVGRPGRSTFHDHDRKTYFNWVLTYWELMQHTVKSTSITSAPLVADLAVLPPWSTNNYLRTPHLRA